MRYWFRARKLFMQKSWRPDRGLLPWGIVPITWEGWTLTLLWAAAMIVTPGAAIMQGSDALRFAFVATIGGTVTVLWLLRGRVKPGP